MKWCSKWTRYRGKMQNDHKVSVVIRCKNDPNVLNCISSIDIEAEVLVSFSGKPELAKKIEQAGAICVNAPYDNLSVVSNLGLSAATGRFLVLTDSDTLFEPGCLYKLSQELEEVDIVRAKIRFLSLPESHISGIVASARDYVNSLPVIYTPGIALRKDLTDKLQGFYFNEVVPFAVDADLNLRIHNAKIHASFVDNAYLRHLPIRIRDDLRAAFRIGRGCEKSIAYWNQKGTVGKLTYSELKGVKSYMLPDIARKKGIAVFFYQIIWDSVYWLGFFKQMLNDKNDEDS